MLKMIVNIIDGRGNRWIIESKLSEEEPTPHNKQETKNV